MAKEKHIKKWQDALTKLNLIKPDDRVEEYFMASWASSSFGLIASWHRGTLIFTKEKLVFMTAFGVSQFAIDYGDIREVKKCFAGFLPMGLQVAAYDKKTDKIKKYKFWIAGRKNIIDKISEKAGLAK